jgi:hypothetical protein
MGNITTPPSTLEFTRELDRRYSIRGLAFSKCGTVLAEDNVCPLSCVW